MRTSIYKWSQYYLMYSPAWRQLTNQFKFKQNANLNTSRFFTKDHTKEKESKQLMGIVEGQSNNVLNTRLSVAWKVLFSQKEEGRKSQHGNMGKTGKEERFLEGVEGQQVYWNQVKGDVKRVIDQIKADQNKDIDKIVYKLFEMASIQHKPLNPPKPSQSSSNPPSSPQTLYCIQQLKKRIILHELMTSITNPQHLSTFSLQQQILFLRVLINLCTQLFKNKVYDVDEEEAFDWVSVVGKEMGCLGFVADEGFAVLDGWVFGRGDRSKGDGEGLFELFREMETLVGTLEGLVRGRNHKEEDGNASRLKEIQEFVNEYRAIMKSNSRFFYKNLYFQLSKVLAFDNAIRFYQEKETNGDNPIYQKNLSKILRKLQKLSHSSQQKTNPSKQVKQQKRCSQQFYLWELNHLISGIHHLNQSKHKTPNEETQQSSRQQPLLLLMDYTQRQIVNVWQQFLQSVRYSSGRGNNNKSDDGMLDISDRIGLVAMVEWWGEYEGRRKENQTDLEVRARGNVAQQLMKVKERGLKGVFNYEFQPKNRLQGQAIYTQLQHMIRILHNLFPSSSLSSLSSFSSPSPLQPHILHTITTTSFLPRLIKTLHRLIVKQKHYIILEKEDVKMLVESLEVLVAMQKEGREGVVLDREGAGWVEGMLKRVGK